MKDVGEERKKEKRSYPTEETAETSRNEKD